METVVSQVGTKLSGLSKFTGNNHWALEKFTGTITGNKVTLTETAVVKCTNNGLGWCVKVLRGVLRKDMQAKKCVLEGTWTSYKLYNGSTYYSGDCAPGKFKITKPFSLKPKAKPIPGAMIVSGQAIDTQTLKSVVEPKRDKGIVLENVLFKLSTAALLPESFPQLDSLASLMQAKPTLTIRLEGHTDRIGDAGKNLKLSQDRVTEVRHYLMTKGVSGSRISTVGYGDTKTSCTPPCKANRRVEFVIVAQ